MYNITYKNIRLFSLVERDDYIVTNLNTYYIDESIEIILTNLTRIDSAETELTFMIVDADNDYEAETVTYNTYDLVYNQ